MQRTSNEITESICSEIRLQSHGSDYAKRLNRESGILYRHGVLSADQRSEVLYTFNHPEAHPELIHSLAYGQ